jgi:HTH-type transcriptional regulator / antitoxin HipB
MIQNERQYRITQTKLKEFERDLAAINPLDPNLHPRQIVGWTNSYNLTIRQLKQEIAEYEQLKSGKISTFILGSDLRSNFPLSSQNQQVASIPLKIVP